MVRELYSDTQGRNEVRWRPGQEASLVPPCSNLRSIGRKFTVLKEVLVTLLGLFGAPRSDSGPGELCSCPPHYAPADTIRKNIPWSKVFIILGQKCTNCFVAIKSDFMCSSIITTNIKTQESTNTRAKHI